MAAVCDPVQSPMLSYERQLAEQEALARGLARKDALNARLLELAEIKRNLGHSQAAAEQRRLQRRADESQTALARRAAQLGVDLAKNRVDLHRWRQRTALLKVRLSSAHEDVERCRRLGDLLQRQFELEVAARQGARAQAEALARRVLALAARMAEQAGAIAALQADLLRAQEAVEARDQEIAAQQQAMVLGSEQAQAALGQAQAACGRLQEQLAAVEERARLAGQAAATAQERANLAEQTLRQKEALLAEKERFQSDVQHFSQDLQKLARETGSVVDGKLQEQLAAAQAQAFQEQQRRINAEGEAQVQRARAEQVQREVERLQRSLAARESLISQLKTARLADTPARQVTQTMELVGSLANDLAATPATDLRALQRSAAAAATAVEEAAAFGPSQHNEGAGAGVAKIREQQQRARKSTKPAKLAAGAASQLAAERAAVSSKARKRAVEAQPAAAPKLVQQKAEAAPAPAKKPAVKQAPASAQSSPVSSGSGWDSEGSDADPDFAGSPKQRGGNGKKQQSKAAVLEGGAADAARPRRQRKQAGAFWMGAEEQAASPRLQDKEEGEEDEGMGRPSMHSPQAAAGGKKLLPAVPVQQDCWEEEQPVGAAEEGRVSKAAKRQKKGSTGQAGAGGEKAGGQRWPAADKENSIGSAAAGQWQRAVKAAPAVPSSRLEQHPLGALNSRVVEAAAQRRDMSQMPITSQLQKVIAARSLGASQAEGAAQPPPAKRRLLSVSSTFTLPGDSVPGHMAFGAGKVPRHDNNRQL